MREPSRREKPRCRSNQGMSGLTLGLREARMYPSLSAAVMVTTRLRILSDSDASRRTYVKQAASIISPLSRRAGGPRTGKPRLLGSKKVDEDLAEGLRCFDGKRVTTGMQSACPAREGAASLGLEEQVSHQLHVRSDDDRRD